MPATSPQPPQQTRAALAPGTRLAEFEIQGVLGTGGFSLVYHAWDLSLHRHVAIKEFMPAGLAVRDSEGAIAPSAPFRQATYDACLRSFVQEAQLLAQFDHPSLVKVFRIWESRNTAYMVMPRYAGITLTQALAGLKAPPDEAWLRQLLWPVTEALQVLHANHTLHRDVSPDNIFLQDRGPPVLLDLGAARQTLQDNAARDEPVLRRHFSPIEQCASGAGLAQGPWTDLYALAAVVYVSVANRPTVPAVERAQGEPMPAFAAIAELARKQFDLGYSPGFVAAIDAALALRPDDRVRSVAAFAATMGLEAFDGGENFDWQAGLGSPLVRAMRGLGLHLIEHDLRPPGADAAPTASQAVARRPPGPLPTGPYDDTQDLALTRAAAAFRPAPAPAPGAGRLPLRAVVAVVAVVALVAMAAIGLAALAF